MSKFGLKILTTAVALSAFVVGSAQAINNATPDATATATVTQVGAGCLHNCSVTQTNNGYGAGDNEQITSASESLTYTPSTGTAGSGRAAAVADPVYGYVGAQAFGGTDSSSSSVTIFGHKITTNIPGTITSTASASISGTLTVAPLTSATNVQIVFSLGGILSGDFLDQASVLSVLTVWANNPSGGTTCGLFARNCYSFWFSETANGLSVRPLTYYSQDWLGATLSTVNPNAADGYAAAFVFTGSLVLPVGAADTLTFYDAITVSASGHSTADFLDPQNLGLTNPPPIVNQTNGFLVPEPASMGVLGASILGLVGARRRRNNRKV